MRIGFVGVGTMGEPMTRNLRKAGFTVSVYARKEDVKLRMAELGCELADTPGNLAETCDVVCMCLTNDSIVEEVVKSMIPFTKKGLVLIDHSTVSPYTSRKMTQLLLDYQVDYLDAPISGGPMGAEAGTLTIMIGGREPVFKKVYPIFEAMGKNIRFMGNHGAGNIAKLMNQMIIGVTQAAISEAFVLGQKMGVNPRALYDVVSTSTGNSTMLHRTVPDFILARNFDPKFTVDLLHKDLTLVNDMGRLENVRLLASTLAEQVFQEARNAGHGNQDVAALILPLEKQSGVEVKE